MEIQIEQMSVVLDQNPVLENINLTIPSGLSVAIVGQSGSGKTTLLRAIAGLVNPSTGSVLIDSKPPDVLYGTAALTFLFQEAYLWQHLTVQENLELVYQLHQKDIDSKHIAVQLAVVGLVEATSRYPHQLSIGMKARAAIARAMCLPPRVLLMDEPFAALDPMRRAALNRTIRTTCSALGTTSIWVTHDVVEAILFSDLIVTLSDLGKIRTFETSNLPVVTDSEYLPMPVRALRDRIIKEVMATSTRSESE